VNALATLTGTLSGVAVTETMSTSFLYKPPSDFTNLPSDSPFRMSGEVVAGTLQASSSGFLGTFSAITGNVSSQSYIGYANGLGDEMDLIITGPNGIPLGHNTAPFDLFYCQSAACQGAFGPQGLGATATESSTVTRVGVPDGDSSLLLSLSAFGAFALAWRWGRKRENANPSVCVQTAHDA
jgi:hypothetical protein